ncbi:MAG: hypothetical protein ACD_62C00065G0004 [uncultured bacterium]|nr:MAG: hypothetical protein ACD_62C00065G0004 [uncultured bacterium]
MNLVWILGAATLMGAIFFPRRAFALFLFVPPGIITLFQSATSIGVTVLLASLAGMLIMFSFRSGQLRWGHKWVPLILVGLGGVYFVGGLISGSLSDNRVHETIVLLWLYGVAYLVVINGCKAGQELAPYAERLHMLTLAGIVMTGVVGMFQSIPVLSGGPLPDFPGFIGHKNHYGYLLCFGVAIAVPRMGFKRKGDFVMVGTVVLLSAAILLSMSRGAWLALFVIFALHFLFQKKWLVAILGVLGVLTIYQVPVVSSILFDRADISTGRFNLWEILLGMAEGNYLMGRGVGFMWKLTQFDISRWGGYISAMNQSVYTHNDFLFFLLEIGVLGVALLTVLYLVILHAIWHGRKETGEPGKAKVRGTVFYATMVVLIGQAVDTLIFGNFVLLKYFPLVATLFLMKEVRSVQKPMGSATDVNRANLLGTQ